MQNNTQIRGFSLVELSVVLTVIGITLAGALDLIIKKTESDKEDETAEKIQLIEDALDVFLANNKRIPCPASGANLLASAAFGLDADADHLDGCEDSSDFSSSDVYAGVIPIKELNLSDEIMFDGWGRRMTYVVDMNFANNITTNINCDDVISEICFQHKDNGSIIINDATGAPIESNAVYAIISHGKNGFGAWKYEYVAASPRLAASSDTDEQDNAGDDKSATFDAVFVDAASTSTFDDIVSYRNKSQMLTDSDVVTDSDLCDIAADSVSACTGSAGSDCATLLDQIDNLCID